MERIKILFIGDDNSGKTSLIDAFRKNPTANYPFSDTPYVPSSNDLPKVLEGVTFFMEVFGQPVEVHLCDSGIGPEYDDLRLASYAGADLVVICIAVESEKSLFNAYKKWFPEATQHCPKIHKMFVLTKIDMRPPPEIPGDPSKYYLNSIDLMILSHLRPFSYRGYWECSSKTGEGIEQILYTATNVAFNPPSEPSEFMRGLRELGCTVM